MSWSAVATPDPIPPELLTRLWALLMEGREAIAQLMLRPRLPLHPRRLRLVCRSPLLISGRGCRH